MQGEFCGTGGGIAVVHQTQMWGGVGRWPFAPIRGLDFFFGESWLEN
jgi:hypothetical protein